MANDEHLAKLLEGIPAWNRWRKEQPKIRPGLTGAELSGTNLQEANLEDADLSNAQLAGANLIWARLEGADLQEANLKDADLSNAQLAGANLTWARLEGADLEFADLSEARLVEASLLAAELRAADLTGADLRGAVLGAARIEDTTLRGAQFDAAEFGDTILANLDLRAVRGLETAVHSGPSMVGVDTLYRSEGQIPEIFLRGAGVPENLIAHLRSLTARAAIEYFSCFLSHSSRDKLFVDRLYADLQARGVRVWYFPEDARTGRAVWGEIDRPIRTFDKVLLVCSEASLQSGPVLREVERALQREEAERREVLFPLRLDDYVLDGWSHPRLADVRSKVIGDFRAWATDPDGYHKAFTKLMADLQPDEPRRVRLHLPTGA